LAEIGLRGKLDVVVVKTWFMVALLLLLLAPMLCEFSIMPEPSGKVGGSEFLLLCVVLLLL
jgi:hypothetical protein